MEKAMTDSISFVVPVNDDEVYKKNFLSSPLFTRKHYHEKMAMRNFSSASNAYNVAIEQAANDLIVFTHQDVFLPESWLTDLERGLGYLRKEDLAWGVLGCFGSRKDRYGGVGRIYTTGLGIHGNEINKPESVETVDEIVIVIRKSSGLHFDPSLPHFHFSGTDICMSAREKGMLCYVIPAFCIHNTNQLLTLPKEFYECYHHIKRRWRKYLPIWTACTKISRYNGEVYERQFREKFRQMLGKVELGEKRIADPRELLEKLQKSEQIALAFREDKMPT